MSQSLGHAIKKHTIEGENAASLPIPNRMNMMQHSGLVQVPNMASSLRV
jgi:hypothetical protein